MMQAGSLLTVSWAMQEIERTEVLSRGINGPLQPPSETEKAWRTQWQSTLTPATTKLIGEP